MPLLKTENNREAVLSYYSQEWEKTRVNELDAGVYIYPVSQAIAAQCTTQAPSVFMNNLLTQWQHKIHAASVTSDFLREDQQSYRRLAIMSCLLGAEYESQGYGSLLFNGLSQKLLEKEIHAGNDFYEQIKTMEWQAGMMSTQVGINAAKQEKRV